MTSTSTARNLARTPSRRRPARQTLALTPRRHAGLGLPGCDPHATFSVGDDPGNARLAGGVAVLFGPRPFRSRPRAKSTVHLDAGVSSARSGSRRGSPGPGRRSARRRSAPRAPASIIKQAAPPSAARPRATAQRRRTQRHGDSTAGLLPVACSSPRGKPAVGPSPSWTCPGGPRLHRAARAAQQVGRRPRRPARARGRTHGRGRPRRVRDRHRQRALVPGRGPVGRPPGRVRGAREIRGGAAEVLGLPRGLRPVVQAAADRGLRARPEQPAARHDVAGAAVELRGLAGSRQPMSPSDRVPPVVW